LIFAKELQKPNRFLWLLQNQVDLYSVQKPELIFANKLHKPSQFLASINMVFREKSTHHKV